ncbi:MAG: lamin tail domain-containing protein [Bacteroidales bacterium]|nr:lamin tail domain-containing protein [Bacteroidales bacterium]
MRKVLTSVLVLLVSALALKAQNVSDLIISEVLAQPDSTGILDDYGRRSGWVELYNKSTGTVNFGGCYLTDDRSALRKSPIPKSDLRTKLGPRQTVLLYCSGNGHDGTFYAGFTLAPGKTVYLVSNDGRTIIDSLQIPAGLPVGKSVIRLAEDIRQQNFETVLEPATPSPAIVNGDQNAATKGERMKERDPHGWILTVVSVSVVFCALAILWFLFWLLFDRSAKKKAKEGTSLSKTKGKRTVTLGESEESAVAAAIALALDMEQGGDRYAAIAAAVHLYLSESVHDVEPGIVTIRRAESGWNNKSLIFRKLPR